MGSHEIVTTWAGEMAFTADFDDYSVRMDTNPEMGRTGPGASPKKLLLAALAGCSGMDVVSLLKKMRQPLSWFDMRVTGELTEGHPAYYKSMEIVYRFKTSDGLEADKVEKAVNYSQERYCGVSALYKLAIPVTFRIEYQ
ncbi:MAG: OsmC family protein [Spirochaetota bacterium]